MKTIIKTKQSPIYNTVNEYVLFIEDIIKRFRNRKSKNQLHLGYEANYAEITEKFIPTLIEYSEKNIGWMPNSMDADEFIRQMDKINNTVMIELQKELNIKVLVTAKKELMKLFLQIPVFKIIEQIK